MTIAQCVATIDLLCSLGFPEERGGSDVGVRVPGFHIAELVSSNGLVEGNGSQRAETAEQFEAYKDGISQLLIRRWGTPYPMGLDGVLLRSPDPEERIPEGWARLSEQAGIVDVWQADGTGRWVAVGVSRSNEEQELQLVVLVTETDPP